MDLRERELYHQIHPAKLATDVSTGLAALLLPLTQAARAAGYVAAAVFAWYHAGAGVLAGLLVIVGGWTWGLFVTDPNSPNG